MSDSSIKNAILAGEKLKLDEIANAIVDADTEAAKAMRWERLDAPAKPRAGWLDRSLEVGANTLRWLALRIECYRVGHDWKEWHCLVCYKIAYPQHLLPSWKARTGRPGVRVCERCKFVDVLARTPVEKLK